MFQDIETNDHVYVFQNDYLELQFVNGLGLPFIDCYVVKRDDGYLSDDSRQLRQFEYRYSLDDNATMFEIHNDLVVFKIDIDYGIGDYFFYFTGWNENGNRHTIKKCFVTVKNK